MIHWRSGNVAHLKIYNSSSPVCIEPDEISWILTFQISIWIRIPFRRTDSRVESQSTVTNYMQMTALGERDVRNIIVGAETERLSKIIAVEVKAIIISRRCYFSCSSGGFCWADVCECRPLHLFPLAPSLSEFPAVCCVEGSPLILLTVPAHRTDGSLAHRWKVLSLGLPVPAMPTIYTTDGGHPRLKP